VRLLAELPPRIRLRPAYDEEYLGWQLREMASIPGRGELRARLVRAGEDVLGWFVYYLHRGGLSAVLQVAARDERNVGAVLDSMFHDAYSEGAAGLQGRIEAPLLEPLSQRRCLLHTSGYLSLVHSRDADLLAAVQSGRALLTRLEGEWWMGHHLLPFD
jgi:hypothetical protein